MAACISRNGKAHEPRTSLAHGGLPADKDSRDGFWQSLSVPPRCRLPKAVSGVFVRQKPTVGETVRGS